MTNYVELSIAVQAILAITAAASSIVVLLRLFSERRMFKAARDDPQARLQTLEERRRTLEERRKILEEETRDLEERSKRVDKRIEELISADGQTEERAKIRI